MATETEDDAHDAIAKRVVAAIIADLTDRRGLKHEWSAIDVEIQQEIANTWRTIVLKALLPE